MKKAEKFFLDIVSREGCVVCHNLGYRNLPNASIHHLRFGVGAGQRNDNYACIGLCHAHHQQEGHGVSLHDGQGIWEEIFGTEMELYEGMIERIIARYGDPRPEGYTIERNLPKVKRIE